MMTVLPVDNGEEKDQLLLLAINLVFIRYVALVFDENL